MRWFTNGSRGSITHRCHMIDPNIWNPPSEGNQCRGSKEAQELVKNKN